MAISAATVGFCVLAGCIVGLPAQCAWAGQANAPDVARSVANTAMRFDLPRQPLAAALERYGQATGLPVFFDAVLVQGRWSSPVAGSYTPREALGRMLESTGLHPQSAGAGQREAFVILPDPPSSGAAPRGEPSAPPASPGLVFRRYDGLAQTRIRETFCADPRLARGDYRAAVQFGIDPAGRIVEAWLLHTTGDGGRDAAIIAALHGVRLDRPPPAHMEQPITLVIQGESGRAFCPAGR